MSHTGEYNAFKNHHSKPFAKVAQGIDFVSPTVPPVETVAVDTPLAQSTSSELGRVGITALREDPEVSAFVNPYETENRADIVAKLQEVAIPYIQAARLEVPNAEENERGIFGGLKSYYGQTPESTVVCIFGERRVRKTTTFNYERGKKYNLLQYGHTEMKECQIHTRVYFDQNEQVSHIICNLPKQARTDEVPEGLELIAGLREGMGWNFPGFEIQFFLSGDQLGAKLSMGGTNNSHLAKDELVYNKMTNSFDFQINATLDSLSPDEFIELVKTTLQFTPLTKY